MLKSVKAWTAQRTLKKKLQGFKRDKAFYNITSAKSFGVIYEYKSKESQNAVNKLFQRFAEHGVSGIAIGYYDSKTLPLDYAPRAKNTLFCQADLNWGGCPTAPEVEAFINEEFDILIDLSRSSEFVFKYIVSLSKAHFRIGGLDYENNPYDFVFLDNTNSDETFVEQVLQFLLKVKDSK